MQIVISKKMYKSSFLIFLVLVASLSAAAQVTTPTPSPVPKLVKVAAPEPFESAFQKELAEAASAQQPSAARLAAWRRFFNGMLQGAGLPRAKVIEHAVNKMLEVADVDQYQAYDIYFDEIKDMADIEVMVKAIRSTDYGKAFVAAQRSIHAQMTERYKQTGLKQKLSDFLVPGIGFGRTVSSNKTPMRTPAATTVAAKPTPIPAKTPLQPTIPLHSDPVKAAAALAAAREKVRIGTENPELDYWAAINAGSLDAVKELAAIYRKSKDYRRSYGTETYGALRGDTEAMMRVADDIEQAVIYGGTQSYTFGFPPPSMELALEWYEKAAALGTPNARQKAARVSEAITFSRLGARDAFAIVEMPAADKAFYRYVTNDLNELIRVRKPQKVVTSLKPNIATGFATERWQIVFYTQRSDGIVARLTGSVGGTRLDQPYLNVKGTEVPVRIDINCNLLDGSPGKPYFRSECGSTQRLHKGSVRANVEYLKGFDPTVRILLVMLSVN